MSGWRRRSEDMEGICEYSEQIVADCRQCVVLQRWGWASG